MADDRIKEQDNLEELENGDQAVDATDEESFDISEEDDDTPGKYSKLISDGENKYKLSGMFRDWFLDYASDVILDRAVPHIADGLKPVQRRILHAMKLLDDGSLIKVATIIGRTMQYHPHGDASIGDALVQLGQKELLIDTQGNWGNILTGDEAAAPRYIEARLSKFANDVVFNPKITEWVYSYDGRNQEPVNLPIKFPLLLAQGTEGIAVGLASKILPHNFNELLDASIAYLKGEEFELYPDFITGGLIDCSRYNRGLRGGAVKVRAKINKLDKRTLVITEIPYGKTSLSLIESIEKAAKSKKIKIKKVDNLTSSEVEIVITLHNDVSPDKTIDALYAFTDCEISISPNSCVIMDNHPHFLGVDEILKYNTDHTLELLRKELLIRLSELEEAWHYNSLEKIFFENKVYRILEKEAATWEEQLDETFNKMQEYRHLVNKDILMDDILKLVEKPVRKISKFDVKEVDLKLKKLEEEMVEVNGNLNNIVEYTIAHFRRLKEKYGDRFPRVSQISNFETIEATKVAVANAKLYINRSEGFIGMDLKKDENAEYICDCSDIDDVIVFLKNGKYIVTKITDKSFVGKNILYAGIFTKGDKNTIYNAIYRDGKAGITYAKRFNVSGVTRDKEYDLTQGRPDSQVLWFSANPCGEAEILKVFLKPRPKLKKLIFFFDFAEIAVKGRGSMGNILSKNPLHKIQLKSKGHAALIGKHIWFDSDINRLNEDSHGIYLGEFFANDQILAICKDGTFYTTNFDLSNRYQGDILKIEKFNPEKTYCAIYFDGESKDYYIKRFSFESSINVVVPFISDAPGSKFIELSEDNYPQVEVKFGGKHEKRPDETIDAEQFIGKKGFRAKGKKATTYEVAAIRFIEPLQKEEPESDQEEGGTGEIGAEERNAENGAPENIGTNQPTQGEGDDTLSLSNQPEQGDSTETATPHETEEDEPTLF